MKVSRLFFILYLAHGHYVSAILIGGRANCGATRTVTAASVVSSNCYRLTNANANLACSRYSNKPTLVNYGTSLFITACQDPPNLLTGPKFAIFNSNYYYVDIQLVSSDTSAALLGTTTLLAYDSATATGYLVQSASPPYDVTQVYSAVLINKLTGATSDPVYFGAKLGGCGTVLAGPSSVTICTGNGLSLLAQAPAPILTPVGLTYTVCSPVASATYDTTTIPNCPIVTASSNNDFTACYIQKSPTSDDSINPAVNYVIGVANFPLVKFTQTLTITATPGGATNFFAGTRSIIVTYDPTCAPPTITSNC